MLVGGHDAPGVRRLAIDPGDHTAGRLAEGDTGRDVDPVA